VEINYLGEQLIPGHLGNGFVILAFTAALLSAVSFLFAEIRSSKLPIESAGWKKIGRLAFRVHSLAVLGIVATLFYMLYFHLFEYEYVWHHSNKSMRTRYILSCFWEGQEGSFLLWTFWHVVIGNTLMRTAKTWESAVMTVVSSVQIFLTSMMLGIFLFEYKIGSNPFTILLRQHPDFSGIPLFQNPNYLSKLDGRGLNPLLQNYWMTIHPPTLFLGFALTLVPFAYAIAGLWKKELNGWQRPALPWAFTGVAILGTGILMGGAWAYEALSFGGFWAWDPVENSSLVPWLTLVGSAHVMLIHKNKGQSLFTALFLSLLSFILVLYSTFLTRSGILGDSSVHAFTDLGMSGQLLIYLFFYILLSVLLMSVNYKQFFSGSEEESLWSREFWFFIGSLILLISSFHVLFNTSMPVWNKLFHKKFAAPDIAFYNAWQLPLATMLAVLIAMGQYLKYRNTEIKEVLKKLMLPFALACLSTLLIALLMKINTVFFVALLGASLFCIFANFNYWLVILKGQLKNAGASVAHMGFGLILLGVLLSTSKKEFISHSNADKDLSSFKLSNGQNNVLLQRKDTVQMGDYYVTYTGKSKSGNNVYFNVDYFSKQPGGKLNYAFSLKPLVQINAQMGNVAEPDTRHFFNKDIYTHVTYADYSIQDEKNKNAAENENSQNFSFSPGDTVASSNSLIILVGLNSRVDKKKYGLPDSAIAVGAEFKILDVNKKVHMSYPVFAIERNQIVPLPTEIPELGMKLNFWKVDPEAGKITVAVTVNAADKPDYIVMEAIVFPWINILWTGCIVMVIGTAMALVHRIRKY